MLTVYCGVFVAVGTAAVAIVRNLDVEALRKVEIEVVLFVSDEHLLIILLFPVASKTVLGTVIKQCDRVVSVNIMSQDVGTNKKHQLFLFHKGKYSI